LSRGLLLFIGQALAANQPEPAMADQDDQQRKPVASFAEIRALFKELPGPDLAAATACVDREAELTKPRGALGRLEELTQWLATWQGRHPPVLNHPRTAVFAANHGVARRGVSAYPPSVTQQMVQNFVDGGAAVNQLCRLADADLRVYEMALDTATNDFVDEDAMGEADCASAMAYGMMAVEAGVDLLALGEMGIGNTTSAAALCLGLYGGEAADWVGPGTGVEGSALEAKRAAVAAGVARHEAASGGGDDPLALLTAVGGLELAAICGAILAARLARQPVLLDGFTCTAAAAVLHAIDPRVLDHCQVAHLSAEPGHRRLLEKLGKRPILDLGMRLGEGSGATLAMLLLKAAVDCHTGMATFSEARVSGPA
jgi:nicotinate-nucleotide--dimethylbenzimidazole phosphoribosyltransferase